MSIAAPRPSEALSADLDRTRRTRSQVESLIADPSLLGPDFAPIRRLEPTAPGLAPLLSPSDAKLGTHAPLVPRGLDVAKRAVRPIIDRRPELEPEWNEIAELMVRYFLSFATVQPPRRRSEAQLRKFLHKRLVPALGL